MSTRYPPKYCIICEALVKHALNHKTNTCDPICTRAKHAGRNRAEQLEFEEREAIRKIDEQEKYDRSYKF